MMYGRNKDELQKSDMKLRKVAQENARKYWFAAPLVDLTFKTKRMLEDQGLLDPVAFTQKLSSANFPISEQEKLGKMLYEKYMKGDNSVEFNSSNYY